MKSGEKSFIEELCSLEALRLGKGLRDRDVVQASLKNQLRNLSQYTWMSWDDAANYLLEEQMAVVAFNNGVPLYVELPAAVELTIRQTDPGVQGDRSTGGTKPATLETGAQVQVPLFITTGEKVKVDTRTGEYLGRA